MLRSASCGTHLVPRPVLEQDGAAGPREVAERVDAAEVAAHLRPQLFRRVGDEGADRIGAAGEQDEHADMRLGCGNEGAQSRPGAPAQVADPSRVDRRQRAEQLDRPAHGDDIGDDKVTLLANQPAPRCCRRRRRGRRLRQRQRHHPAHCERGGWIEQFAAVAAGAVYKDDRRPPQRPGRNEQVCRDAPAAAQEGDIATASRSLRATTPWSRKRSGADPS